MESSSQFSPSELYDEILDLQRNLLAATTARGPCDPKVRRLRDSIRDGYEAILLRAPASFIHDFAIEHSLWRLHYQEIEGLRLKIRKLSSTSAAFKAPPTAADLRQSTGKAINNNNGSINNNNGSSINNNGSINNNNGSIINNNGSINNSNNDNNGSSIVNSKIEEDNTTTTTTTNNNNDNINNLSRKRKKDGNREEPLLRALASFKSFLAEASGFFHVLYTKIRLQNGVTSVRFLSEIDPSDGFKRCMEMCHKILIYLGDLARYREFYAVMDAKTRDWSVAAAYYKQASVLWPYNGNAYHQLAVLCTYCGNSMAALYLNCRSLAAKAPFLTAWDNLDMLFDKNKHQFQLAHPPKACDGDKEGSQFMFILCFIEFVRVLLHQASENEIDVAYSAAERQLDKLFHVGVDPDDGVMASDKVACDAPLALQVITVLIFCMHQISGKPETVNHSFVPTRILIFSLKFCSALTRVGEDTKEVWSAYPVAVVFIEWLASCPESLQIIQRDNVTASSFSEFCEGVISLDDFLLNKFAVVDEQDSDVFESFDKAQMEDSEVYGFIPLEDVHVHLDFKTEPRSYGIHDLRIFSSWKKRFTEALEKASRISGGSVPNARSRFHDTDEQKLLEVCVAKARYESGSKANRQSLIPEASVRVHFCEQAVNQNKENAYDVGRKRKKSRNVSNSNGRKKFRMANSSTNESILSSVRLDQVSHVVPSSFMDSLVDSRLRFSLHNAVRKNMRSLSCIGLLTCETYNPFLLRLESLSEL